MDYEVDTKELRKCMADMGIYSIDGLSEASGVSRVTIGNVLNGKTYPSSMAMRKIKTALEIPSDKAGMIFFKEKLV